MASRRRAGRRTWPQRLLLLLNCLLVVACLAGAALLATYERKISELRVVSLGVALAPKVADDAPRNYLLIGLDSANRLADDDPARAGRGETDQGPPRSDVLMILRVDPKADRVSLLSIPRDSYVNIASTGRKDKINAAITAPKGPENLIRTIKEDFGISISHYIAVDFLGVRQLVDELGGVPVYLTTPIRDSNTGLLQESTGCVTLDPVQALAYVRSRHFQYRDPTTRRWVDDPTSDYGRMTRQQDFLTRAAERAVDRGARNPATALGLINAGLGAVTVDSGLSAGELLAVAQRLRNFDPRRVTRYQLPTEPAGSASFSYVSVLWNQAEPVLDVFRGLDGSTVQPRDVQVSVRGPASADARLQALSSALEQKGFDSDVDTGGAGAGVGTRATVIRYGPKGVASAQLLASYLDGPVRYVADGSLAGARLVLEPDPAMAGVRSEPKDLGQVPRPGSGGSTPAGSAGSGSGRSSTTTAPAGTASTTTPAVTTTTAPGFEAVDPKKSSQCR